LEKKEKKRFLYPLIEDFNCCSCPFAAFFYVEGIPNKRYWIREACVSLYCIPSFPREGLLKSSILKEKYAKLVFLLRIESILSNSCARDTTLWKKKAAKGHKNL